MLLSCSRRVIFGKLYSVRKQHTHCHDLKVAHIHRVCWPINSPIDLEHSHATKVSLLVMYSVRCVNANKVHYIDIVERCTFMAPLSTCWFYFYFPPEIRNRCCRNTLRQCANMFPIWHWYVFPRWVCCGKCVQIAYRQILAVSTVRHWSSKNILIR